MDRIQRNLTEIELGLGVSATITSIGSRAFSSLPSLRTISLSGHRIKLIRNKAFSFDQSSNKSLTIDLTANYLTDESFEIGAFSDANRYKFYRMIIICNSTLNRIFSFIARPLKIYFGLNGCNKNLTTLNQTVFEPFFLENERNLIDVGRSCNQMSCDARMHWIWTKNYEHRVKHLKCNDTSIVLPVLSSEKKNGSGKRIGKSRSTPLTTSDDLNLNPNSLKHKNYSNSSMRALDVDDNE